MCVVNSHVPKGGRGAAQQLRETPVVRGPSDCVEKKLVQECIFRTSTGMVSSHHVVMEDMISPDSALSIDATLPHICRIWIDDTA